MVKQLLDPLYLSRLVAAPSAETRMKHSNKKINGQRDEENALGRSAKKAGLVKAELDATIHVSTIIYSFFSANVVTFLSTADETLSHAL